MVLSRTDSLAIQLCDKKRNSPDVKKRLPVKREVSAEECFLRLRVFTIFSRSGTERDPGRTLVKRRPKLFAKVIKKISQCPQHVWKPYYIVKFIFESTEIKSVLAFRKRHLFRRHIAFYSAPLYQPSLVAV